MNQCDYIQWKANGIFAEMNTLLRFLSMTEDRYQKNLMLNQLWNLASQLQLLIGTLQCQAIREAQPLQQGRPVQQMQPIPPPATPRMPVNPPNEFTREQLSRFNGRDGNPAYVAVNGIVYDVTNNAAWSAATHFGLSAGQDLTKEFASCHAGQQWILRTMKPIGRLVE
ncbi:MAG: cytochrome b5 domain-containing protein [Clostridia bacterium]